TAEPALSTVRSAPAASGSSPAPATVVPADPAAADLSFPEIAYAAYVLYSCLSVYSLSARTHKSRFNRLFPDIRPLLFSGFRTLNKNLSIMPLKTSSRSGRKGKGKSPASSSQAKGKSSGAREKAAAHAQPEPAVTLSAWWASLSP